MSNYKVITDEKLLVEFINNWLPQLQRGEVFYCSLFARKKYCKDVKSIKSDKAQLKRFVATKDYLLKKIKQLEVPMGCYTQGDTEVPQEALALYINPNPRSLEKATRQSLIKFANLLSKEYGGYNPQAEVLSEIQKGWSRKVYFDIDFDDVEANDIIELTDGHINRSSFDLLKTRGGFHMLLKFADIDPKFTKTWYNYMANLEGVDISGDNMIPMVGTYQGGHTPHFLKPRIIWE